MPGNKRILIALALTVFFGIVLRAQTVYRLPKVLYLTTGADAGRGTVSDGIVYALQAFNREGVQVRLESRKILLEPERLAEYDLMFVPAIAGYHDAGRKYGLTFMADEELKNISAWIKNGGMLVSDVNMGRNTLTGKDRLAGKTELNATNWELGDCVGTGLKEINTKNFRITDTGWHIFNHPVLQAATKDLWRAVPANVPEGSRILLHWTDGKTSYPAAVLHRCGKGKILLLPTYYILHPLDDGGLSTKEELNRIYHSIYEETLPAIRYPVRISPWKDACSTVYCQTFDDGGNKEEYRRIFDFIERNELPTVFFVTPGIDKEIIAELQQQKYISLQGHSYSHPDFRKLNYEETYREFLLNKAFWQKDFKGFRFPYVSNSFWGMYWLEQLGFTYETSIAANNIEFVRGSVVPYNIPVFKDGYYLTLDLLEISQIYHSDWYFYQKSLEKTPYTPEEQQADAGRFEAYLKQYFDEVVAPENGIMVFLGHPMYAGYSETTLKPLQNFIDYLKTRNVWFASLNEVAERWKKLSDLQTEITEKNNEVSITLDLPAEKEIKGFTLLLPAQPQQVITNNKYQIQEKNGKILLILDIAGHTEVKLVY